MNDGNEPAFGLIEGDVVKPIDGLDPFALNPNTSQSTVLLSEIKLLPPVAPSKIVCIGRNYREHAAELGNPMPAEPLLFLKAPSAIISNEEVIRLPPQSLQVEHEGEIGVVIRHTASKIGEDEDPLQYVLGYTCVNDVTARDLQRKDIQFTRAKSFDTFCPVGPFVVTDIDPLNALLTTSVNGEIRQQARASAMAFSIPYLLRYISHIMTLFPGDLIATGTPAGVSRLVDGDIVEVEIEGACILRNPVASG